MIPWLKFKSRNCVGLHIHEDEVRLIYLKQGKGTIYIKKLMISELSTGTIEEGNVNNLSKLQDVVRKLVVATGTQGCDTVIALPAQCIMTHQIQSSVSLTDTQRQSDIESNLSEYFPGIKEKLTFDFYSQEKDIRGNRLIFLVAIRQALLLDYIKVVEKAGLNVKIVEIDLFALARLLHHCFPTQTTIAIFNGKQFSVFYDKTLIFTQSVADSIYDCAQQLKQYMQLCLTSHRYIQLDKIYVCATQPFLESYIDHVKRVCQIDIAYVEPLTNMVLSKQLNKNEIAKLSSRMLISCGLALRGLSK